MEIIRIIFNQLEKIYSLTEYYIDRVPSSEVGFWFFNFWVWGGIVSIVFFVFVIVQYRIRLMTGWMSKSERHQLQMNSLNFAEALLMVRQPHVPRFSISLTYFNFFSFFIMGWLTFIYFLILLITKRYQKPVFTQLDLVFWKKVDLLTTYVAGSIFIIFIILLILL